ncbi:hypothetical protein ACLGIH_33100 [Streptomyces sp. HMX87]|uniref:hypothetical protein n=1 Tax=Streptomyces sp. HMX87 TaxID=3390849 RepID=UPI003A89E038
MTRKVGIACSGELKVGGSVAVVETEGKVDVILSVELTAKMGNTISDDAASKKTTHARYGVHRLKSWDYSQYVYANCTRRVKKNVHHLPAPPARLGAVGEQVTLRRRTAACTLILLVAAGCTPDNDTGDGAAPATSAASSPTPTARQTAAVAPPALDPGLGESTAGQHGVTRGNANFPYRAGAQGKALIVAVSCQGTGTVKVEVPVLQTTFPLECSPGGPAVTYNQLALKAAHKAGTVKVTAPSTVIWAVIVGRGDPAEQDSPGAD